MFLGLCRCFRKRAINRYNINELLDEDSKYNTKEYIWHKKIEQYTDEELKKFDLNTDKLNFIYGSGISFVREVHEAIKDTRTHATILLGYLVTIMFAAIGVALRATPKGSFLTLDTTLQYVALILALSYFLLVMLTSRLFFNDSISYTYFEPAQFMKKNMLKHNENLLKIYDARILQILGSKNLEISQKMDKKLECYVSLSLMIPVIIVGIAFIWENWWSWFCYLCQ